MEVMILVIFKVWLYSYPLHKLVSFTSTVLYSGLSLVFAESYIKVYVWSLGSETTVLHLQLKLELKDMFCISWFVRVTKGNFFDWQSMHSQTMSFDTLLNNKNTLTGPANISKSRIFFKNLALSLFYLYSSLTSCKKSGKSLGLFLRKLHYQPTNEPNIEVSHFGLIWRPFHEYLQINNFFQKFGSVTFYLYSPLTSCKKSEKSLELFLRKLHYQPTNQPNIKVPHFGLIWRHFCEYLQIKNFFQKFSSVTFLPLWSRNLM